MNILDFVILFMVFIYSFYGFFRGSIRGIFSIISLVLGLLLAVRFYPLSAQHLSAVANDLMLRNLIGFIFIFIGVSLVLTVIGIIVRRVFTLCKLGTFDRVLGALLGLFKGIFMGTALVFGLIFFLPSNHSVLIQSRLSLYFVRLGEIPLEAAPDKIKHNINSKKEVLLDHWKTNSALFKGKTPMEPESVTPQEET